MGFAASSTSSAHSSGVSPSESAAKEPSTDPPPTSLPVAPAPPAEPPRPSLFDDAAGGDVNKGLFGDAAPPSKPAKRPSIPTTAVADEAVSAAKSKAASLFGDSDISSSGGTKSSGLFGDSDSSGVSDPFAVSSAGSDPFAASSTSSAHSSGVSPS